MGGTLPSSKEEMVEDVFKPGVPFCGVALRDLRGRDVRWASRWRPPGVGGVLLPFAVGGASGAGGVGRGGAAGMAAEGRSEAFESDRWRVDLCGRCWEVASGGLTATGWVGGA